MEKYENLTEIIKDNLIYYRKKAQLTQLELAEKVKYSDKSISKWERGEGVPDIYTLANLAKLYGLTVNDFLTTRKKEKIANKYFSKVLITCIAIVMVWFLTTIAFISLNLFAPDNNTTWKYWLLFIYAIPVSAIVLTVFNDIYFKRIFNIFSVSVLCWGLSLSLYLSFINQKNVEMLFYVAIPFQIIIILFYLLIGKKKKNRG